MLKTSSINIEKFANLSEIKCQLSKGIIKPQEDIAISFVKQKKQIVNRIRTAQL